MLRRAIKDSCQKCKWWNGQSEDSIILRYYECRRNAPEPPEESSSPYKFPVTRQDDWCGDFELRDKK